LILDGTVIFEIPIYSMPKDKFDTKWQQKIDKMIDEWVKFGWEREKAELEIERLYGAKAFWKYNQIVGYIAIEKSGRDIFFELLLSQSKKHRYDCPRLKNISYVPQVGQHFYVDKKWSNKEIADEIYWWLKREAKYQKERHRHLDLTLFETTYKHIDYKTLFAEMKEQNKWKS